MSEEYQVVKDYSTIPQSDEEWTTHVLNIQGTPFERRCREVVRQAGPQWKLQSTNYPVAFPPASDPRSKPKNLDIWAEWKGIHGALCLTLPVECKKNNPEYTNWIFFEQSLHLPVDIECQALSIRLTNEAWRASERSYLMQHDLSVADDARETKRSYQSKSTAQKADSQKTKTANAAISEASHQIALATRALIWQEHAVLQGNDRREDNTLRVMLDHYTRLFLPTIVTTAQLYICRFTDEDVSLETGELPLDKVTYTPCPYLFYKYPVPPELQPPPSTWSYDELEQNARMNILVVHSTFFPVLLTQLSSLMPPIGPGFNVKLLPQQVAANNMT